MGYTHYYTQQRDLTDVEWNAAIGLIDDIIRVSPVKVRFFANDDYLTLNGIDYDSHEDFCLTRVNSGFNFCKTARKPYDLVVCAALILINQMAPDVFDISSDGSIHDWRYVIDFLNEHIDYDQRTIGFIW